jgi:ABC-type Mn2+/Zn2+ transport system permease subunit
MSFIVGIGAYVLGLVTSAVADLPSGPVVVLVMAALAALGAAVVARANA